MRPSTCSRARAKQSRNTYFLPTATGSSTASGTRSCGRRWSTTCSPEIGSRCTPASPETLAAHPDWFDGGEAQLYAQLASHWDAARDAPRALGSALDAARAAEHIYAYGDALDHAEQVLTLWSHVTDAEARTGLRHVDMLRYAATQAEMSGSTDRALDYIRAAAVEIDPVDDPVVAGLVHERWGRYLWMLSRPWPEIIEHCEEAVRLVPETPSAARAKVLATLGQQLMLASRNDEAISVCEQAIAIAQMVGDAVIEGHALNSLGAALGCMGRADEGLAAPPPRPRPCDPHPVVGRRRARRGQRRRRAATART